jgi:hypothetical protein
MKVCEKPQNVEFFNGRNKWMPVIETLTIIDATKSIEYDVNGFSKSKVSSIKTAIRNSAKKLKFNVPIRFAIKNNTLFIWANK